MIFNTRTMFLGLHRTSNRSSYRSISRTGQTGWHHKYIKYKYINIKKFLKICSIQHPDFLIRPPFSGPISWSCWKRLKHSELEQFLVHVPGSIKFSKHCTWTRKYNWLMPLLTREDTVFLFHTVGCSRMPWIYVFNAPFHKTVHIKCSRVISIQINARVKTLLWRMFKSLNLITPNQSW